MKIRVENLNKRIDPKLKPLLRSFSDIAESLDIELYIVGGLVRDLILKRDCLDLDLLLSSKLDQFIDSVQNKLELNVEKTSFLTAKVEIGGFSVDIAQARRELYQNNGSLPEVCPGEIEEDFKRRDFTVNSLMGRVYKGEMVEVLDYAGGLADIDKKLIRIIKRGSLYEDPTRIIRALRYKARFGFKIEESTLSELREAINSNAYGSLSAQRVGAELLRVFKEDEVFEPIRELFELNAMGFLPPIKLDSVLRGSLRGWDGFKDKSRFEHYFIIPLNIIARDLSREDLNIFWDIFELTKHQRKIMVEFRDIDKERLLEYLSNSLKAVDIYDRLNGFDMHSILSLYICASNKRVKRNLLFYVNKISKVRLQITGEDVKALGIAESPSVGEMLEKVLRSKVSGALKSRADEVRVLKELLRSI
ncbi:MAG: hypothetical protein P9X27_05845 [Candidatus Kaelpia aquatica]|nr:hypothetical protein [Candidatus Kaelpia aquatica]